MIVKIVLLQKNTQISLLILVEVKSYNFFL